MNTPISKMSLRRPKTVLHQFFRLITTDASTSSVTQPRPLYLDPHKWIGLPADRVFELHNLRVTNLGEKYVPNNDERRAILSTISSLKGGVPKLEYGYEIDNFKERIMNNTPLNLRGLPPKLSNKRVFDKGGSPHKERLKHQTNRLAAFEMPLLAKYRQPYTPAEPSNSPIQLTFQTDFTDSPNEFNSKVTLTVELKNLNLQEDQAKKFILLCDKKFDHSKQTMSFSSSRFPESTQNARWLVETFNTLLKESKDLTKNGFKDIPINKRQRKQDKVKCEFPEGWKRPQDAPVQRHQIVQSYIQSYKEKKDQEYLKSISP